MCARPPAHSLGHMKRKLFFILLVTGLLLLALGGWTLDGLRKFRLAAAPQPA